MMESLPPVAIYWFFMTVAQRTIPWWSVYMVLDSFTLMSSAQAEAIDCPLLEMRTRVLEVLFGAFEYEALENPGYVGGKSSYSLL